jgi:glycosyltransferase involved in cell wall biosynthesis
MYRIGHFSSGIFEAGGVASYITALSKFQQNSGHKIFYLIICGSGDEMKFMSTHSNQSPESLIFARDLTGLIEKIEMLQLSIFHLHSAVALPSPSESIIPMIRTVHVHTPYCPSGSRYLKRWQQPCDRPYSLGGCLRGHLIDRCGSMRLQNIWTGFERVWQEMETLPQIHTIANSEFVRTQMLRSGYPADKLHKLLLPAPAVQDYTPPPREDTPHFLYLGRIAPQKGWEWLLRSLTHLKIPIHLDIAGTGNEQQNQEIRDLATALGLNDRITLHGWVKPEQAQGLLQNARALIFPSVWHEPAGLVTLEAAAMGRAVIASDVGGIPEYGDRLSNVILVAANDQPGLVQSMERLAQDWQLACALGQRGRQNAIDHFSMAQHEQELMQLYQRAIADKKSS